MKCDILIAGVGGQGTVLASRVLAAASIASGYFTRTSETIGMAQRGGCVVSHVRVGSQHSGSVIPMGEADLLIGFEPAETIRNLGRLSKEGRCIVNTRAIKPVTASLGSSAYDVDAVYEFVKERVPGAILVDGYALAADAGSVKAVNIVLLGVAASTGLLPFGRDVLEKVIRENVPAKFLELNLKALDAGFRYGV